MSLLLNIIEHTHMIEYTIMHAIHSEIKPKLHAQTVVIGYGLQLCAGNLKCSQNPIKFC
jgi:hypothetical protein